MDTFKFEAPAPRDAGPAVAKGAVHESELKYVVTCEESGFLWRVRDKTVAEVLGQVHTVDTGHVVHVELRDVTRRTGW